MSLRRPALLAAFALLTMAAGLAPAQAALLHKIHHPHRMATPAVHRVLPRHRAHAMPVAHRLPAANVAAPATTTN